MDKKTLLLVFALTLTFMGVNHYFDTQRIEKQQEWLKQQKGVKEKELQSLQKELSEEKLSAQKLSIASLFKDAEGKDFLSDAISFDGSILTLSWDSSLPDVVYSRSAGSKDPLKPFKLSFTPHDQGEITLYQTDKEKQVPMGSLPYFGKFPVQLVSILPKEKIRAQDITLGTYLDGRLILSENRVEELKKEIDPSYSPKQARIPGNAIVFVKSDDKFIPAGIFLNETGTIVTFDQIEGLSSFVKKQTYQSEATDGIEKFFVLENNFQQLVFSNKGGALVEINLPFENASDIESVVKEIGFDRDIQQQQPFNALFPAHPFATPGAKPEGPYEEHAEGKLGGYYPLLRRSLILAKERETLKVTPPFYALNIVSEYPEMAELVFQVKHFDKNKIVFEAKQRHRRIVKTYTLPSGEGAPYIFDLTIQIEGDARGLWLTTGVPEAEWISNASTPVLKFRVTKNGKSSVEEIKLPQDSLTVTSESPDWVCNSNGFLGMILDPITKVDSGYRAQYVSGTTAPSRLIAVDQQYDRFQAQKLPGYMLMIPLDTSGGTMKFRFFAGPFATGLLKKIDSFYSDKATGYTPDYIDCQTSHGWFTFISGPFSKFLLILMTFFHQITGSWGLSIILLTIALRVMLYPLNAWQAKSSLKMQQVQPEMAAIQERYKKDPKKMQLEIMNLYKERGVNPVSGCFPLLIQLPFLIGMFDLLKSTFELRGASFIPGWINDLAAPDVLFSWTTPLPIIGNSFHLLPILSGLVMFFQQKMMSPGPTDPNLMTDQQRQQKVMGTFMSVFLIFIFYNFPSGLNIYFLSSSLLGILQQWVTKKTMKPLVLEKGTVEVLPKRGAKK